MPWFAVLMTTVGSAAIASIVTILVGRFEAHRLQGDTAPLSALLVCNQLEVYGAACAEIVLEDLGYARSKGKIGALATRMTPAPEYAADIAWKALGSDTANELFNFRAQVLAAQRFVATLAGANDPDAVSRECIRQSIGLGLRAYAIARMLRTMYSLAPANLGDDWDPAVALAKWHLELSPTTQLVEDVDGPDDAIVSATAAYVLVDEDPYEAPYETVYEPTPSSHPLFSERH
ncbi:hypothetical protein BH10PSE12_BH10PSE12_09480 [soil metagenome]